MSRIRQLREKATRPELLDSIKEMKIKIRDHEDRYDVVSPEELTQQLDADETDAWDDLTAWRTTRQYLIRFLGQQNLDERVFRQSGLIREKWDEVHYADGSTYREKTIERTISTTSEFYDLDAADPHGTPDEADLNRAYLAEKNRLLSECIDELETTLEQKTDRIETLGAEVERLTDELATRDGETGQSHEGDSSTPGELGDESETRSMWGRLVGRDSE